jgi:ribosomal-protein-alanine N-acetyltransferase
VKILKIDSAKEKQLPAIFNLDNLCFGGLWSLDSYQRELASPNSTLLILSLQELNISKDKTTLLSTPQVQELDFSLATSSQKTGQSSVPVSDCLSDTYVLLQRSLNTLEQDKQELSVILEQEEPKKKGKTQIIGIGCFWTILEEAHITLLGIHPEYQGQGLGQLLLYALLKKAVNQKLEWATLEVRTTNIAALSLYQKFGFEIVGKRKKYYQVTGEDALILWQKKLAQPEFKKDLLYWQAQINERLQKEGWLI